MAVKKSNENNSRELSGRCVFSETNGVCFTDAFGLSARVARVQDAIFQAASRMLTGFTVQAISSTGNLERLSGESRRNFVLKFKFEVELAPFSGKAIDRCQALMLDAQLELQPDEMGQTRLADPD